jgi:hypothetical protein
MQPYFFPYLGYFQLASHVDFFVIYDDVQYTKKGWLTRNKLNSPQGIWNLSLPTSASSVETLIREKKIAPEFNPDKLQRRILNSYPNSQYKDEVRRLIEKTLGHSSRNLFTFLANSLSNTFDALKLDTSRLITSSSLGNFTNLKAQDKLFAICRSLGATTYVNPIGGRHLYDANLFLQNGIELRLFTPFFESQQEVPLSILDTIFDRGLRESEVLARLGSSNGSKVGK